MIEIKILEKIQEVTLIQERVTCVPISKAH
jgi:hypothetical protein